MAKIQYKLQNFSRTPAPFTSDSPTQQLDLLADFLRLLLQGLDVVPLRLQLGRLGQSPSQSLTLPGHSVVVSVDIHPNSRMHCYLNKWRGSKLGDDKAQTINMNGGICISPIRDEICTILKALNQVFFLKLLLSLHPTYIELMHYCS